MALGRSEKWCFLFRKGTESEWSAGKKAGFWVYNIFVFLLGAVCIGILSMMLASGPYDMFPGFFEVPLIAVLNILPGVFLSLFLYALIGRAWAAYAIHGLSVFILSMVHYQMLFLRDDPFQFSDILFAKEAGNIMQQYRVVVDWKVLLFALALIIGTFCHLLFVRSRMKPRIRIACATAVIFVAMVFIPVYRSEAIYNHQASNDTYIESSWSLSQKFVSHGFLYPFLHGIGPVAETSEQAPSVKPEGDVQEGPQRRPDPNSKETPLTQEPVERPDTEAFYDFYRDADIPADKKINLIGIMLESYNDLTKFDVAIPFSENLDIYGVWHDLQAESYTGRLVTNVFAGGTIDTERTFLTGYSTLPDFDRNIPSYPWYFQSQGYKVEGMHAGYEWFYDRNTANRHLGFENYYFIENYFQELTGQTTAPRDDIFFPELLKQYRENTRDGGLFFQFSVTYQGHGPFDDSNLLWGEYGEYITPGSLHDSEQIILENYLGSIYNTNQNLAALTDALREDDIPVVLVLFGDHNPWLGDGNSVYRALGIDFSEPGKEGFYRYYATEYIIWANPAAKEILGNDFKGVGPDIGPYFLMNEVFNLCGWDGPAYMQAVREVKEEVPVIHKTGPYIVGDMLTDTLDEETEELMEWYEELQYFIWKQKVDVAKENDVVAEEFVSAGP